MNIGKLAQVGIADTEMQLPEGKHSAIQSQRLIERLLILSEREVLLAGSVAGPATYKLFSIYEGL